MIGLSISLGMLSIALIVAIVASDHAPSAFLFWLPLLAGMLGTAIALAARAKRPSRLSMLGIVLGLVAPGCYLFLLVIAMTKAH